MYSLKIVFIGTVEFSKKALEKLICLKANIVGVFTKEQSLFNSDFADLASLCIQNNIPCFFVDNINESKNIEILKSLNPNYIFCFGWSQILRGDILNIAPVIGFHPAKLPQNRGRHPLIWALVLGLKESASTFFFMDSGADSGDILSQIDFKIEYEDCAKSLYEKVVNIALTQIEDFLPKLQNGNFKRIKQDHSKANYWRKRGKDDGRIDFRMSASAIYNLVRALSKPYIGASINYKNEGIKIWRVREIFDREYDLVNIEYGKVLWSKGNTFVIKCYDGILEVLEHEFKIPPKQGEYL